MTSDARAAVYAMYEKAVELADAEFRMRLRMLEIVDGDATDASLYVHSAARVARAAAAARAAAESLSHAMEAVASRIMGVTDAR